MASISPGHAAGKANVRRYYTILAYLAKMALTVAAALAVVTVCVGMARGLFGLDLVPARMAARLAGVDPVETGAMLLGLALALTTGVPMGVYLHGLMAGYDEFPDED